jgi:dihydroxyacetone kinase
VPGTLVQTLRGVVAIEDIVIGDYVLTHKNRYMKVTETFIYERDESLFFINGEGSTSNHEYYVIERKYKDIVNDDNLHKYAKWISAEELDEKIHLLIEY